MFSKSLIAVPALVASAAALDVVIYGGGITSGTLNHALKDYDHINVQYFDPALNLTPSSYRLMGIAPQAHNALKLIGPDAYGAIERAGWYPEEPSIIIMGQGPDAGKVVLDYSKIANTTHVPQVTVIDPAEWLKLMLEHTPESHLHPNHTLLDIKDPEDGPLELTFTNGKKVKADVLIADGNLWGSTRQYVLGPDNVATYPRFMNVLSAIAHVPPKEARKLLGSPYGEIESGYRFERVGSGSWFLNAYLDGFFTCLGSFYTTEDYNLTNFARPTSEQELTKYFSGFKDGDNLVEILSTYSGMMLIPEIEHLNAPTYVKGRVAIAGNEAHTMTNFQQLGQGAQVEDAMILGAVLGAAYDRTGVTAALEAYDVVRRPRNEWIAHHGKQLGLLWMGKVEGVGIDPAKLRKAFLDLKNTEEKYDLAASRKEALTLMAKKLQTQTRMGTSRREGWMGERVQERIANFWKA
ncbi:Protein STB3 [Sphaceloma murrayae]|uniref:Protein STB3 n=1 Tax=Sphaceloma murrayae TaxID=2082308 RepID=A0A2K1R2R1_9PEZI|nr:Protein STB3 [Sphaceloma murrayae]